MVGSERLKVPAIDRAVCVGQEWPNLASQNASPELSVRWAFHVGHGLSRSPCKIAVAIGQCLCVSYNHQTTQNGERDDVQFPNSGWPSTSASWEDKCNPDAQIRISTA
uniref:Uncharacterized protein n=1 Tax=Eutreptiella gymnastica TaxID=73025 RepID=A0A7S4D1J5_9EUGL